MLIGKWIAMWCIALKGRWIANWEASLSQWITTNGSSLTFNVIECTHMGQEWELCLKDDMLRFSFNRRVISTTARMLIYLILHPFVASKQRSAKVHSQCSPITEARTAYHGRAVGDAFTMAGPLKRKLCICITAPAIFCLLDALQRSTSLNWCTVASVHCKR